MVCDDASPCRVDACAGTGLRGRWRRDRHGPTSSTCAAPWNGSTRRRKGSVRPRSGQATYLRGWIAARDAYRAGGSPESLKTCRCRSCGVERGRRDGGRVCPSGRRCRRAERARQPCRCSSSRQSSSSRFGLSAGLPGAPVITAHEAAGDLWLQVHRYEDARRAYQRAAERLGPTRRDHARPGARRRRDSRTSRRRAGNTVRSSAAWKVSGPEPQEIIEARRFLGGRRACIAGGQ